MPYRNDFPLVTRENNGWVSVGHVFEDDSMIPAKVVHRTLVLRVS